MGRELGRRGSLVVVSEPGALDVGGLLREARARAQPCLTQRELAQAAGVSKSAVDQLESGRRGNVSLRVLERLLAAAGFQLDAGLAPLGDDIDRAAEDLARLPIAEVVARLPYRLGPHLDDFAHDGMPYVITGRLAALLQGVPIAAPALDLIVAREHGDQVAGALAQMRDCRWNGRFYGYCPGDPREPGHDRWSIPGGELRLSWVDALPVAVTISFDYWSEAFGRSVAVRAPVLPLLQVEVDDPRTARALSHVRARLASSHDNGAPRLPDPGHSRWSGA